MRHHFLRASALVLLLSVLAAAVPAQADPAAEYAQAQARSMELTETLQSYSIVSDLVMENNVKGQEGGMKMAATQRAYAKMPDRLSVSIESSMLNQQLGTGPMESWFMTSSAKACYVGQPLTLTRDLNAGDRRGFSEEAIFNFYTGLGNFLLTGQAGLPDSVAKETLEVQGRPVACQVFKFQADAGSSTFWFDAQSGLVLKARMTNEFEQSGSIMERALTTTVVSFELDPPLEDDLFTFESPAGLRVVDSMERVMNPDSMVGVEAPDISFTRMDGTKFNLKDFHGKVVFIDFWATWCGPCKMEMPHIEKLYQEFKNDPGIAFIGASNEDRGKVQGFLAQNRYNFPIVMVDDLERSRYKVSSIPAGFVIDAAGVIRAHMIGVQTEDQLRSAFKKAGFGG